MSVLPQLFVLIFIVIAGIGKTENHLVLSYLFIGLTIIPLLLFQEKTERRLLIATLVFSLVTVLIFDLLLVWSENGRHIPQPVIDDYFLNKVPLIIIWVLIVVSFLLMKKENIYYMESLEKESKIVITQQSEIGDMKNEILSLRESLNDKQSLLNRQNENIESRDVEIKIANEALLKNAARIENINDELTIGEAKNILKVLNDHYLLAWYDLSGNLVSINAKVKELLGELQDDFFKHIKPIISHKRNFHSDTLDEQYFSHIWDKIINGKSHTINLKFDVASKAKCLATTFTLLFNSNRNAYEILAIGQDISAIIMENGNIDKINEAQKEKLSEVNQQIDLLNFQQMDIFEKSELLISQKEEIKTINESLELRVKERTQVLEKKNMQLAEYAFINSHVLRSPLSTMMGLINLIKYTSLSEDDQKIYEHLKATSTILDDIVMKINNAIDNGVHFDRHDLEPERNFHAINHD